MPDQTDDTLALEPLHEDELAHYLLRGRQQIRHLLQDMIDARALISIHILPGSLSFLSTLLMLSEDEEWLFLDASPSEAIHRRALEAERLLCITQLNKIRIQFRVSGITEVPLEGRPALTAPLPSEILRLQRRDAFRLVVPISHKLKCLLPESIRETGGAENRDKAVEILVIDVSASGLSLEIPVGKTVPGVGDTIKDCSLKLPGGLISVNLEVRNHGRRILGDGREMIRLGCSFIGLPTHAANQIQRYIYQTEREIRARL
ncbi:MAG: flagellar brake protein [Azoarcus sp.]|jgi:c-di-GMP-binding flagellar brake protein YcgR|nr:flagellar brake protein [Azoarcus sp.]